MGTREFTVKTQPYCRRLRIVCTKVNGYEIYVLV
jgi:hypothetical protein